MSDERKSVNCPACHSQNWELMARHAGPIVEVDCKECGRTFPLTDETFISEYRERT